MEKRILSLKKLTHQLFFLMSTRHFNAVSRNQLLAYGRSTSRGRIYLEKMRLPAALVEVQSG